MLAFWQGQNASISTLSGVARIMAFLALRHYLSPALGLNLALE